MDALIQDLRYALRQLARTPVLSAVAVFVLAIGIGTSAVVFSVLDGILFRAPPGVGDTSRLVEISSVPAPGRMARSGLTYREFLEYRDRHDVFSEVAVYHSAGVALRAGGSPEMVRAELASSGYFAALDVRLALGTGFVPSDDRQTGGATRAVLGYAYWQGRLGGSHDVVGRTMEANGRPYTVTGVAPEGFYGARGGDDPVAVWLPAADRSILFQDEGRSLGGDGRAFRAVARIGDGVTIRQAEAAARNTWRGLAEADADPDAAGRRIDVTPYRGIGSERMADALAVVGVIGTLIGGLILLIACTNVSGLLLGRSVGRRHEIGVRLALGAGRRRVVRQLLTESLLLAGLAGVAGMLLTFWGLDALESFFTFPVDLAPSVATLGLTLGVTGACGLAFGLTPALHATRVSVFTALKDDIAGAGRRNTRLRDGFTAAQLALSLPLLTGAGLLGWQLVGSGPQHSFADPESVLTLRIDLGQSGYAGGEVGPLLTRVRDRVAALPGVSDAAFTSRVLSGYSPPFVRPRADRGDPGAATMSPWLSVTLVDPEYFSTMGVPILRGRAFESSDAPGAPVVAVVDEEAARRTWPGEEPVGRTLIMGHGEDEVPVTVVGVAGSVSSRPGMESGVVYGARRQLPDTMSMPGSMTLVVRFAGGTASALAPVLRAELRTVDPDLVVNVRLLADALRLDTELAHGSAGAAACGIIALLLACVGLYGTIATGVSERTREIGVRIALGADRGRVVRHFVRKGLIVTLIALGVGLPLSWATFILVGADVVGVSALAPEVALGLGSGVVLMMAVALVSSWLPARRSSAIDPVLALRSE